MHSTPPARIPFNIREIKQLSHKCIRRIFSSLRRVVLVVCHFTWFSREIPKTCRTMILHHLHGGRDSRVVPTTGRSKSIHHVRKTATFTALTTLTIGNCSFRRKFFLTHFCYLMSGKGKNEHKLFSFLYLTATSAELSVHTSKSCHLYSSWTYS
jgi:hypothetical protein